ncbi:RsmB/NOP family class I SAM-dependent RNA methyltransferase [Terricaulis silvestris]|uniref:Ribosomal RNA small subunit methyltransferase F n=1 Tax=Terricaulis silvestris TaxID=2686094 RepID=A0A6I6MQ48_9CAUL|nr:RsmB/NOP family class I SAM-dependent RNA methyltransferase [Terricaulis silvestris]QGZ95516.1 Ribosomal RNA small subunit methyltransferase F [Terricaulis silvestris]
MRHGARQQAAIEILSTLENQRRPASDAVKDWMLSHRFAGSKDRAEIGDLVFGALRWKQSSAWRMGADDPRAWVWGALRWGFGREAEWIEQSCYDDPHAPPPPTEAERAALSGATLDGAPAHVRGDYPEWLDASFARAFGDARAEEGAALAVPASLDLRANTLKSDRDRVIAALGESPKLNEPPSPTPYASNGVRIPWAQGRTFPWATEQSFVKGWFEVQDEGSQLAALLSGAEPGMQVADVCAGGGGKTLALAALMQNKGQIFAHDVDGRRLAPLKERLDRAGVRNAQIRAPMRTKDALEDLRERMDVVFVDAPCTGSGTWRRSPDSKWRLRPNALLKRRDEQQQALAMAAPLVKPGGRLMYVTCSVLPEENEDAVAAFLGSYAGFAPVGLTLDAPHYVRTIGVQMTPLKTGCDGFYVAALQRTA